eukprot:2091211-Amphidinium_carterae.3
MFSVTLSVHCLGNGQPLNNNPLLPPCTKGNSMLVTWVEETVLKSALIWGVPTARRCLLMQYPLLVALLFALRNFGQTRCDRQTLTPPI